VLLPVLAVRGWQPTPRPVLRRIAECGLVDAVSFGAFAAAAARGPVSVASVCAAQFSTVSVIVAIIVLRERPAPVQLVGIGLTLVGTTVLAAV
jgi:drug/metabolite transporter (DMT)-like permease